VKVKKNVKVKTTRSSPHHVAQHCPTGSETTPPYAPRSSRFGSEPPSAEDDVDIWRYAILELNARNDDDDEGKAKGKDKGNGKNFKKSRSS